VSEDILNIWVGKFESDREFNAFMDEKYSRDDDVPLSEFAASQNKTWYDHDWLEYYYSDTDQKELFGSILEKYHYAVRSIVDEKQISGWNAIILFAEEWSSPVAKVEEPELWHLGQFDPEFLKNSRSRYEPGSISSEFWTDFPQGSDAMEELKVSAQDDIASKIKLGVIALCGIGMDKDEKLHRELFAVSNASPTLIREALHAVANLDYAEAWYALYGLSMGEGEHLATDDERRSYIETAVRLGSDEAKSGLATMLMYGWGNKLYSKDYDRAEELLLSLSEYNSGKLHQVYCLYGMKKDKEKAFVWKKRDVDTYGHGESANKIARSYLLGEGVEIDRTESAKYLYIKLCQLESDKIRERDIEFIEELTDDELGEGRRLAREWVENVGLAVAAARGKLAHFSGEIHDPFEARLKGS